LSVQEKVVFETLKMGVDLPDSPMMDCFGLKQPVELRGEDIDVAGEKYYNMLMNSASWRGSKDVGCGKAGAKGSAGEVVRCLFCKRM
jgi:hypothetical protein